MTAPDWIELASEVCAHAGIRHASLEIVRTWEHAQNAVYRLDGERYLKLYRHEAQRQFAVERCALQVLERAGLPAPRLLAAAWTPDLPPCVLSSGVAGTALEDAWPALDRADRLAMARELGALTAAIHRLPLAELARVEDEVGSGREAIERERSRRSAEIEGFRALSDAQRAELRRFLDEEARAYLDTPPVFGHCDLSHAHVFAARTAERWRVSAVIDWAEASIVTPEWDLAYLWFWTLNQDRDAMRALLAEGFYRDTSPPDRLARRCYAAVLHTDQWPLLWHHLRPARARHEFGPGPMVPQVTAFLFPPEIFGAAD